MVDGIRMDHVRRCICGRRPEIATCYHGMDPGDGPFIIKCYCGRDPDQEDEDGRSPLPTFVRSWSKTRAVRAWRSLQRRLEAKKPVAGA
ncbi:hypothetical protein [Salipiger mucosus]|uniref:Uncharacterized protein n=1 Tax=Salipiger mucosus DSM 16094 TaxID=1123237 RepID=S9QW79_9RHOB|nr:hypothetical protein [Salipiger mucosus]EPX83873.1 hypothetical protein Salmuc_01648 [Salipiger mucosus DSM 16094]